MSGPHPSHVTRFSDASTFDEICVNCGAHDHVGDGWGRLALPCPHPPKARTGPVCLGCGRIMSAREAREQGACNDCRPGAEPHVVGTDAPTPENDPIGRFRKP